MHNYHTHTYRCKHAEGDISDYAAAAIKAGLDVLGMSDHIPYPDGRWDFCRMEPSEAEGYIRAIEDAQAQFPDLKIFKGMESEYIPEYRDYYNDIRGRYELDYMIGAVHWFPYKGEWMNMSAMDTPDKLFSFTDHLIELIESGRFLFIAHPDNFGSGYLEWDKYSDDCSRRIIQAAVSNNIPLEVNGFGFRKRKIDTPSGERRQYPLNPFWEIAGEYQVPVVFNSDAHKPEDTAACFDKCGEIVDAYNLKLVDPMGVCCG